MTSAAAARRARLRAAAQGDAAPRPLRRTDAFFVPACFLLHAAGVAAVGWLPPLAAGALSVLLGLSSMQLVLIAHDGMHGSLRIPRWTHPALGRLLSAYSFVPYHYLRHAHLMHHRRAGLIDGDTEILHPSRAAAAGRIELRLAARIARWPLAPAAFFPILQVAGLVRFLLDRAPSAAARAARRRTLVDLALPVLFWGALLAVLPARAVLAMAVLGLAVPMAIGTSLMHLGVFPLHTGMVGASLEAWSVAHRAFLLSRTFHSNAAVRFLLGNANYHVEHHLWPQLDRWQLAIRAVAGEAEVRALAARLGVPYQRHGSYLAWYRRYLRTRDVYNEVEDVPGLVRANAVYERV